MVAVLALLFALTSEAQPVVTNATRSVYARVTDPLRITFAPDGTLFVGRDNGGSGGGSGDAIKIHRIAPGGSPVTEFGNVAIADPDAVAYDASGKISGTAGAVIVGGASGSGRGKLSSILPDGTVTTLFGPSSSMPNPGDLVFDAAGRLLLVEGDAGNVWVMTNATPVVLISGLTEPSSIAVDALGRIVLSFSSEERLSLYSATGILLSNSFVTAKSGSPLARGPGGMWGTGLYYLDPNGKLMTVDTNGNKTSVGSRFDETAVEDLKFGPDGALYASDFDNDRIFRFAQPAVPNATTTIYARVTDPQTLSFAPDGTLFLGRDASGSGGIGADAVKIARVAPGGSPVSEYGTTAIADPDAVVYDVSGKISGTAGAVIVGGVTADGSGEGQLSKISPDGAVTRLFGPSSSMINPGDFVFDVAGRLLIADSEGARVWVMTNATPRTLISELDQPSRIAVDSLGRILVSSPNEASVRLYSAAGTSITNSFVRTMDTTPLALGPGGFWGTGVFCVNTNGDLLTVDLNGHAAKFGTGFGRLTDIGFGPDGALYASQAESDLIWRIAPSVVVQPTTATTYTFTTLAGSAGTSGVADGTGSAARFYQPANVALDSAGNAYVTDHGNHTIRKITPDGVVSTLAGLPRNRGSADGTGSAARFYQPAGLALDSAGNLYVADYSNHTIRKVTSGGVVTTLAGLAGSSGNTDGAGSAARFDKPDGVAVDGAGNVYVADGANHTIRKVTSSGVVTTLAGLAGSSGSADGPGSAARFYVPAGLALDSAGNLFVADYSNHTIRKVTPGGIVTTVAGLAGSSGSADGTGSAARFNEPNGVAVDSVGNIYVADYSNHTIRKVTPGGIVTTLGGLAGSSGRADGPGSMARFQSPCAVAVDRAGRLYVTDLMNSTIRIGTPTAPAVPNAVTTVYARVTDPDSLCFAPDGTLFVGADASGSGGRFGDAVKIHRIAPGGSPVTEYGNAAIADPNAVVYDATGKISGTTGAVVVGGATGATTGKGSLTMISPGGTVSTLFGPSSLMRNPNDFVFDAGGRLLFVDSGNSSSGSVKIWVMTNATPQTLVTGLNPGTRIAVDSLGRVVINSEKEAPLRLYSATGTAISFPLVQTEAWSPLGAGPGGFWGTGIFCVSTNGDLLTVDVNGNATKFGTGFRSDGSVADFAFGPDGALYASDFANDLIWRIAPAVVVPNQPPAVTLANPSANALFYAPANPTLKAAASDTDGTVVKVEFYQGAIMLGEAFYPPFTFTPTNLPAGTYSFTAKATDGGGLAATSAVLTVNVRPSDASPVITGQWDFEQGDLRATVGNDLEYFAPAVQAGTQFGTTRSFGIADIGGQVANVMKVPYLNPMDGYIMRHGAGPNGGGNWVNQYTLIFDLFYPASVASQWKVLLQETPDNSNDGDFFIDSAGGIGYGSSTSYQGKVTFGAWHRITLAVDLTVPVVAKFIDGAKVGEQKLTEGLDKRWALLHAGYDPNFALLFADDDGENCEFYVNSVQFLAGRMSDAAVAALGGPSTSGIPYGGSPVNNLPTYTFSTLAGLAGTSGTADGTGNAARFNHPTSVAVDSAGNIYVSDYDNHTIRKITTGGVMSTLAGLARNRGSADGTGSAARFYLPNGVAVDSNGNVYVADQFNHTIRKVTPGGVVTTLAGLAGSSGSADGTGSAARFNQPVGLALDGTGNVYVGDYLNNTIRKVTPGGVVTTLAGLAGSSGSADGTGSVARFDHPEGPALDSAGNIYVADGNHTIRKITPGGVVTTLAGLAGSEGSADGTGSAARFDWPSGLAVDSADNIYVPDYAKHTIRRVTPGGVVTTLAGLAGSAGSADGTGSAARFYGPGAIVVDRTGKLYLADTLNHTIRIGTPDDSILPAITLSPQNQSVVAGSRVVFTVAATGTVPLTYQWRKNGVDIAGATSASLALDNVQATDAGTYTVVVTNAAGSVTSAAAALTVNLTSQPPTVSLTKPANNATFPAPATVVLEASASDTDGTIVKVEFFSGATKLGEDTTAPYSFTWNNVAAGMYSMSAKATDSQGAVTTSSAIAIAVGTAPPPTASSYTFTTLAGLAGTSGNADGTGSAARFNYPGGVAVDSAGNVYVADSWNSTIRKITPGGVVSTLAGLAGNGGTTDGTGSAARFSTPGGVAVDSSGNVYVADGSNQTIRKITPAGVVSTLAGLLYFMGGADGTGSAARFNFPADVAVDSTGNVYVADGSNHKIRKITPGGVVTTLAGMTQVFGGSADGTGSAARFNAPQGVAVDSQGNVYVADYRNHTMRKITPEGGVGTLAGLAGNSGSTDGTGSAARFYYPRGVAADSNGNIYVADSANHTIRKITPGGVVSTLAGLAGSSGSTDGTGRAARFNAPQGGAAGRQSNL